MHLTHFRRHAGGGASQRGRPRPGALVDDDAILDLRTAFSHLRGVAEEPGIGWPRAGSLRERLGAVQTVDDVIADPSVLAAAEDIAAHFQLHVDRDHPAFLDRGSVTLSPPLARPGHIFVACHRRNLGYDSTGQTAASHYPSGYFKLPSSICGLDAPARSAPHSRALTAAAYPTAVIGRSASNISIGDALNRVTGYLLVVDLVAADVHASEQAIMSTSLGVNWPGAAILGPAVLCGVSDFDADQAETRLSVDGVVVHTSKPDDFAFTMAELIAHWSLLRLAPLDMVARGRLLRAQHRSQTTAWPVSAGSVLKAEVDGLGTIETRVAEPMTSAPEPTTSAADEQNQAE